MTNPKLYIDVTQLVHWPGRLTGIPRVMNELAIRYSNEDKVFLVWSNKAARFYEIDILETLKKRGERIEYIKPKRSKASTTLTTLSSTIVYKTVAKNMPGKRTMRRARGVVERARLPHVDIKADDILFVLWGEWAERAYISKLQSLRGNGVKLVQVAYDLLPILTPQYSGHSTESMSTYNAAIMPICSLVLSISESTKKDLAQWMESRGLKVPRIETFRLGDDFQLSKPRIPNGKNFVNSKLQGKDYILCVGTIEARKNHTILYYAYKLAYTRNVKLPKLVIVGRRGWKTDNIYDIMTQDPQTKNQIVVLTSAGDEELSWLYGNALFSVYPSFYEGWGLPIAESALYGLPCLCSNTSSIPEIAGDLVQYFNPSSSDECLEGMQRMLDPIQLEKAKKSLGNYKTTSWDDTFEQVKNYIQEL